MVDQELAARLRQRSRQSGVWLGLAMALAIFIALAGFIWIYARLAPVFSDFVSRLPATPTATATATPAATPVAGAAPLATPTPAQRAEATPTATPSWRPTHRVAQGTPVNFRGGPGTNYPIVDTLPPGTELRFLGEQEQVGNAIWLHLELRDGRDGWIRTVDLELVRP